MELGLHALDAALAIADGGELCSIRPSIIGSEHRGDATPGGDATGYFRRLPHQVSTRHWRDLNRDATAPAAALLVRAELRQRKRELAGAGFDQPCAFEVAVPSSMSSTAISRLYTAAQAESIAIKGFYDASVLAVASSGLAGATLVVELGLHHLAVSRVAIQARESRLMDVSLCEDVGRIKIQEAWLQLASDAMVKQSRFDPLHEGETEQRLYDALMAGLPTVVRNDVMTVQLATVAGTRAAQLSRSQLVESACEVTRQLSTAIRSLRVAGQSVTVLVSAEDYSLPGIPEVLAGLRQCTVRVMPQGFLACAVSRQRSESDATSISLRRQLPVVESSPLAISFATPQVPAQAYRAPTHVFHAATALPLRGSVAFEIGRARDNAGLILAESTSVSRRHCTLRWIDGEIYVIDHSRVGTWLNQERVLGRARVQAGDRLQLGDERVEIELIAVGVDDGPSTS